MVYWIEVSFSNIVSNLNCLGENANDEFLNGFLSFLLSGDNLPEEHCKYTRHFFLFPLPFTYYSLIAHTLHTLCSAKNMLFTARREHSVLLPYVSLFAIVKAFFCTAHFCFEAVINIWFHVKWKHLPFHFQDVRLRRQLLWELQWLQCHNLHKKAQAFWEFDLQKVQYSNKVLP